MKENDLIQKANIKLSVKQQRFIAYLFSQLSTNDIEYETFYITIQDFCKITETKEQDSLIAFMDLIDDFDSKCFSYETEKYKTNFKWFLETAYDYRKGQIKIILAPTLRKYLLELQK